MPGRGGHTKKRAPPWAAVSGGQGSGIAALAALPCTCRWAGLRPLPFPGARWEPSARCAAPPPVLPAPAAPRPGSGERGPSEVPGGGGAGAGRGDAGWALAAPPRERAVPRARRVMLSRSPA